MARLDELELASDTAVLLISDHGTNFCRNSRRVIGKPADAMYPGVMQLPFVARLPNGSGAGRICDELVYNIDLTATAYDLAGVTSGDGLDGRSLLPLLRGTDGWSPREYVTCRYGHSVCYVDDQTWALGDVDGTVQELFDLKVDPHCQVDVLEGEGDRWKLAWERLLRDAGGASPDYRQMTQTDAIGQKTDD